MLPNRMKASLLRPILALFAFAGLLALGGCGGGSGAPNNPFAPKPEPIGPLFVLPPTLTAYAHTPATLTISGGAAPYQAFSGNQSLLPVSQLVSGNSIVLLPNDVAAATPVVITVQDAIGQTATSTVTVSPAPIFNTLTITPARTACGANTVCSGDTATATVTVTGNGGAGIPNRQVRFDVVSGAFFILSNNPAQPLVSTLTVTSDSNGVAPVTLQAAVNAPTQPAMLRATEVTSGNSVTGIFTIVQVTSGAAILSVVPPTATITGAFANQCSGNFRIDYYIYGGTAPYSVSSTFPAGVTLVNSVVPASGGFFTAITNGSCVNPLVFTIVDSVGRQTTATLINQPGTATPPTPPTPPALVITPTTQPGTLCTGKTFQFLITGGTPPYGASAVTSPPQTGSAAPQTTVSNGTVSVLNIIGPFPSTTSVVVVDQSSPQKNVTGTVTCSS
jgi:hypothetical protein